MLWEQDNLSKLNNILKNHYPRHGEKPHTMYLCQREKKFHTTPTNEYSSIIPQEKNVTSRVIHIRIYFWMPSQILMPYSK